MQKQLSSEYTAVLESCVYRLEDGTYKVVEPRRDGQTELIHVKPHKRNVWQLSFFGSSDAVNLSSTDAKNSTYCIASLFDITSGRAHFIPVKREKKIPMLSDVNFAGSEQGLSGDESLIVIRTRLYVLGCARGHANTNPGCSMI